MTAAQIIAATAADYRTTSAAILGRSRALPVVKARHTAMWLVRDLLKMSYPQIARIFGGRDHTTVMHACREVTTRAASDPMEREVIAGISRYLAGEALAADHCPRCAALEAKLIELRSLLSSAAEVAR